MAAPLTAFFPTLEEFCTKYFVKRSQPLTIEELAQQPARMLDIQKSLFEQLLLFDQLAFKVRGENIPLILLLRLFEEKGLEELLEQGALRFIQWKPSIFHMVTDIPGVDALAVGDIGSPAIDDPEQSIELAFAWLRDPPSKRVRKILRRKVASLYETAPKELATQSAALTKSAYYSGKLAPFGLPLKQAYTEMPLSKRELLNKCASEISEYSYVLDHRMTSLSNYTYFSLLADTAKKLNARNSTLQGFSELTRIERFPDLKVLFSQLQNPLLQVARLRNRNRSRRFRHWLAVASEGNAEISAEYVAAIANAKGPLDTMSGKFLKAVALTAIGTATGAAVTSAADLTLGLAAGTAAMGVGHPVLDFGFDLLDEFVLNGLTKGWSPRLFFDDLKELERRDLRG
jgi:hypothetical protein